jgi:hypothetical protein
MTGTLAPRSKTKVIVAAFLVHILAWVGFEAGRHRVEADVGFPRQPDGARALRLAWSETSPLSGCRTAGHVVWRPGLWSPRLVELGDDSELCCGIGEGESD